MITITVDLAAPDELSVVSVARIVDQVRARAGVGPLQVIGVYIAAWHGPGGGNPEVAVTFADRESALRWVASLTDGEGRIDGLGNVIY